MKRIICTALASLMLLSATACGKISPDTAVTATASAAEQVLVDRFGEIPSNVILGDAAVAAEYGIDMTDFEGEGYIVRTVGDSTLVFGKTGAGLDRAVRYYANYVYGNDAPADVTFGEGARVDRFTIEGHDISEYIITVTEAHPEGSYPVSTNHAADELAGFIKDATGVVVPIVAEAELAEGQLHFRFTCDGSGDNGEEGFTVTVTPEGNVEIMGGLKRGCFYAACDIAEKWLGMRFMYTTYIYEAEHIAITAADSYSEESKMDLRNVYAPAMAGNSGFGNNTRRSARNKNNAVNDEKYGYIPRKNTGSHGLVYYWETGPYDPNPCMTDEGILEMVIDKIYGTLIAAEESGAMYKGDYYHLNLGHNDSDRFCYCQNCSDIAKEAGTYSEVNARFVKEIADTFAEEFPRVQFFILAYSGLEKPCKTVLPDNITVTYCITGSCYRGTLDGASCVGDGIGTEGYTVAEDREHILGWNEVTSNLCLWIYYFTFNSDTPKNVFDTMYKDVQYIYNDLGIRSIFVEWEDMEYFLDKPGAWVMTKLLWDPEMSREEYDAIAEEALRLTYGDGYEYITEYLDIYRDLIYCTMRNWGVSESADANYSGFAVKREYIIWLFDQIIRLAQTAEQQRSAELMFVHALYDILVGLYREGYSTGTEAEQSEYFAIADRLKGVFEKYGYFNMNFMGYGHIGNVDWTTDPYEWITFRG